MSDSTAAGGERIAFRPFAWDDLMALFLWLGRPHVAKWYARPPSSYAETVARYGSRTEAGQPVRAHVVLVDGAPVGYAQHYAVDAFPDYAARLEAGPGTAAMDLLIGEEAFLGRGIGSRAIHRYAEDVVFADPAFAACVGGPMEGHAAGIRAFEKAGFARWKTIDPGDGPAECVMRRERD